MSANLLTDLNVQDYEDEKTGNVILAITVPMAPRDQRPIYIKGDILKVPFKLVGRDRIDDTPVHKALREVLTNCLVNGINEVG